MQTKRFICAVLAMLLLAAALPIGVVSRAVSSDEMTIIGDAYYDEENDWYVLTEEKHNQSGGIWFSQVRCNDNFSISLEFYSGHEGHTSGADGIVVAFYADVVDGSNGEGLGFEGCGGYGVEIDTYENSKRGDPEYNHIAILQDSVSNHLQIADATDFTEDGLWHLLTITNRRGVCTVKVDDTVVLQQSDVTPSGSYNIGITAATGGSVNYQAVRNITLTEAVWTGASTWADTELERAQEYGIIPDSMYDEDFTEPITRDEFAAVALRTYQAITGVEDVKAASNPFTDCSDEDVLKAYTLGIVNGMSATTYEPKSLLTREQAAAMLTRVFKKFYNSDWTLERDSEFPLTFEMPSLFADDKYISDWARESVYFMAANGIINGMENNKFAPKNTTSNEEAVFYANSTREQALAISVRLVDYALGQ